jgi:putative DNA primase/helicase
VDLARFADGREHFAKLTPRYFSTAALDYEFSAEAPEPVTWLGFLHQLWPNDEQSIDALQEFFGYCLTPDTRQQKILALIGPRRSGKGTIARVLRGIVGKENVCGPTLASLGTNFGLSPMIGKTVAVISDARLSGKTDQAAVVERLLSISGEDALTIDRKYAEPLTCKLSARIVILSNELPRLTDTSGALVSRMILLRLTESFLGREDHALTDKLLGERPGILLWSVEGWRRLRARGHFDQPDSGLAMVGDLHDLTSPVTAFIADCCVLSPEFRTPIETLFDAWSEWCKQNGRREPGTRQSFGRDLLAAVPALRSVRPRDGESRYRGYDGIGLAAGF